MSNTQCFLDINTDRKRARVSGIIAEGEMVDLNLSGLPLDLPLTGLVLQIMSDSQVVAICTDWEREESVIKGTISLKTVELSNIFQSTDLASSASRLVFTLIIYSVETDVLYVNSPISIMNNPFDIENEEIPTKVVYKEFLFQYSVDGETWSDTEVNAKWFRISSDGGLTWKEFYFVGPQDEETATALSVHAGRSDNPHSVTKAQLGLSNVDDTSDADKPISISVQSALDNKLSNADFSIANNHLSSKCVTEGKIADYAVSARNMNKTAIVNQAEKLIKADMDDELLIYNLSGDNLRKIKLQNLLPDYVSGLELGDLSVNAYPGDKGKIAYDHSISDHAPIDATAAGETGDAHAITAHAPSNATAAGEIGDAHAVSPHAPLDATSAGETGDAHAITIHAPTDAQKNSDITKEEIEAKLIGEINSHTHASTSVNWGGIGGTITEQADLLEALNLKVNNSDFSSHLSGINPHSITKTHVGLENVDNTSDVNKPISTATQTALDLKADAADVGTGVANTFNSTTNVAGVKVFDTVAKTLTIYHGYGLWVPSAMSLVDHNMELQNGAPNSITYNNGTIVIDFTDEYNDGNITASDWRYNFGNAVAAGTVSDTVVAVDSTGFTGNLSTDITNVHEALEEIDALDIGGGFPTGSVISYSGTFENIPDGFLLANGAQLETTEFQDLFNVVGYRYGGSGGNFNLPAFSSITESGFFPLGQTSRSWQCITPMGSDVYACVYGGDIYKQTGGVGDFLPLGQASRDWGNITSMGSDVYACASGGDIYKQTGGVGDFLPLGQTSRSWRGMDSMGSDVYACVYGGDIYKQTGGVGDFLPLGQTSRDWFGITSIGSDVYASVYGGDIYKQTGGVGDFLPLGQTSRNWTGISSMGSDVYACVSGGDIYKQRNLLNIIKT